MDKKMSKLSSRVEKERKSWNSDVITLAQGFKKKIKGAFDNPHSEKLEKSLEHELSLICRGGVILDYGCFDGDESVKYIQLGALKVYGIDISDVAIERAKKKNLGDRAEFLAGDAHNLPFENDKFDLVIGRAILHHLDLKVALQEVYRVLKPGGAAIFIEPLGGNPMAKLIRVLTPNARTSDEKPLNFTSISLSNTILKEDQHHYSGFFSSPIGAITSLMGFKCNNFFTRIASRGDDLIAKTPLKFWGRIVFLRYKK